MAQFRKSRRAIALALVLWPILACTAVTEGSAQPLELQSGIIVDLAKGRIYLMGVESAVEAISIAEGETIWSSTSAAKPLAASGDVIVCQAETPADENNLPLVVLDADAGDRVTAQSVPMPSEVAPAIDDGLTSRFSANAIVRDNDSFVSWNYQSLAMRGVPPGFDDEAEPVQPTASLAPTSGTLKINLLSGEVSSVAPQEVPQAAERTAGVSSPDPTRRQSADGRHTLKSERIEDDSAWERYRWSIVDNATGQEIGRLKSHLSQAPFVVTEDSRIIFTTGAYARRTEDGMLEEPRMIRMVELGTGETLWTRPVRETAYRGPLPP